MGDAAAVKQTGLSADLASLAACSLIWGTTWYAIKLEVGVVPVAQSVVYRFALAAALLFAWCRLTGRPIALSRRQHIAVLRQGAAGFALQYACVYFAEERIASGAMAVIFSATAFVNLVLFRLALNQKAAPLAWAGTLLGLVGVGCMSFAELRSAVGGEVGVAVALAGVLAAAVGNLFASRVQAAGIAIAPGTAWAMAYGAGLVGLYVVATGGHWSFDPTVRYVGGLLYLAAFGSVAAFVIFYGLARRRGYTFAAYIAALTPPTAMLVSSLFEGAHWSFTALAGVALVLAGQALLIRASRA